MARGRLLMVLGSKVGNKYMSEINRDIVAVPGLVRDCTPQHRRLGHRSKWGVKVLSLKGKWYNLKSIDRGLCEDCVLSMQKCVNFSKIGRELKKNKLQLVHTNVWELAPVPSLGVTSNYVTFTINSTREVLVYFLYNKFDAFATFKRWKAEVEKEVDLMIKCLRSDNGG